MDWTSLLGDIRHGTRTLRREPGYAATAILAIALGIGATTTLFSVADGVLLKPLPWPEPERLVRLEERRDGRTGRIPWTISSATYLGLDGQLSTLESVGTWMSMQGTFRAQGDPERVRIARVTPSLFTVLNARPATGRLFDAQDVASRQADTAILSHGFWQRRFGGAADVVGRSVQIDDLPHTIVGVMPEPFMFPDRETHMWIPAYVGPVLSEGGKRISVQIFAALARRRAGVTIDQVSAETTSRAIGAPDLGSAALALFGSSGTPAIVAAPALDVVTAEVRPAIRVLFAAVLLLLATAVGSVATLQLARATRQRREMTVRAALGAGSTQLMRLWVVESALTGMAGGALGLLGAGVLLRTLPALLPAGFPRLSDVVLDWRAATFAALATLLVGTICGLIPGLQARRLNLVHSLSEESLAATGGVRRTTAARTRAGIMTAQVAIACILLVGAGLLARNLLGLVHADRGYDPNNLLTARLPVPARMTFTQAAGMLETMRDRLRGSPGVIHAAFGNALPLVTSGGLSGFNIPSPADPSVRLQIQSFHRTVSPDYFGAMRLRLVAGRLLSDADTSTSQPVLVVNRSFASQYLGDEPVGRRLPFRMWGRADWEVIGIVDDMKQEGLDVARFTSTAGSSQPEMFSSYRQVGEMSPVGIIFVVRTAGDPVLAAPALRHIVREEAPALALDSVMTMEDRLMSSLAQPRMYALVLGGFAVFALAIALVGLMGVLSYNVAQRTREIGVRTALGARRAHVVALVLKQGIGITIAGSMLGMGAATLLARSLASLLHGVQPFDPLTFTAAPLVLAVFAALACAGPAMRATRIDPARALRSE